MLRRQSHGASLARAPLRFIQMRFVQPSSRRGVASLLSSRSSHSASHVESLETRVLFTIPGTQLDIWHTYAQATADLNTIHNAYPNLTRLISIGKTAQNRDMWAMEITDNPGVEEDEPEFLYNGQIHGDEPIGMENSFHLIQYLLENYGATSSDGVRATNIVN